jgi:hypothetical protein
MPAVRIAAGAEERRLDQGHGRIEILGNGVSLA